ncbi:MAG: hypothetical protein IT331_08475 [Anaerolineae bacterium]|nr:hypothetical protein [Anaerolineae bacterium]
MFSPRFVLVLSAQSNLLCASLVTRELKNVASAKQTFQLVEVPGGEQEFDPAEVWYKLKRVIQACLDIGRTLSREIAGVAIVGETRARVVWSRQGEEIVSRGYLGLESPRPEEISAFEFSDTLANWLWWNLTGGLNSMPGSELDKTRARSPFDAELPIIAVWNPGEVEPARKGGQMETGTELVVIAAELAWTKLDRSVVVSAGQNWNCPL